MRPSLLSFFVLCACSDPYAGTDDSGDHASLGSCDVDIEDTVPADQATDAYYRAPIEFHLSDPDPTATIETDIPGQKQVSTDGRVVSWVPDGPLAPSTAYTVTVETCRESRTVSFTTSDLGTPLTDPSALVGGTYRVHLADARFVEPRGIGNEVAPQLTRDFLFGVTDAGAELTMLGATGEAGADQQDWCSTTFTFPPADFAGSPDFAVGPQTAALMVAGFAVDVQETYLSGTFAADGSSFGGGQLTGILDTRPLVPLLSDDGDDDAICKTAENFGASCEACPSDGAPYCLPLLVDQIVAPRIDGSLVGIDRADCDGCDAGPPAEDATCPVDTGA